MIRLYIEMSEAQRALSAKLRPEVRVDAPIPIVRLR